MKRWPRSYVMLSTACALLGGDSAVTASKIRRGQVNLRDDASRGRESVAAEADPLGAWNGEGATAEVAAQAAAQAAAAAARVPRQYAAAKWKAETAADGGSVAAIAEAPAAGPPWHRDFLVRAQKKKL
jgi:hypothetical protein